MAVVAVTPVDFGKEDGSVKTFKVGETLTGLSDNQLKELVEAGSAVETSKEKKYKSPYYNPFGPGGPGEVDEETRKRDALIAGLVEEGAPGAPVSSSAEAPALDGPNQSRAVTAKAEK